MAPPLTPKDPQDLAEVERALSVLKGRHPEHERARREDEEAVARRGSAIESAARMRAQQVRSRNLRLVAIAVPLVALVVFLALVGRREMRRQAVNDRLSAPFRALGFTTIETSSASAIGSLEASVEPGCIIVLSTHDAPITLTRAAAATTTATGASPMLFCTCVAEHVTVRSAVSAGGGVVLMRAEAATIGGSRAFAFTAFKPGAALVADEACADASLDAWIAAKHYPAAPSEGPSLATWPARERLTSAGFRVVAYGAAPMPFVVVDAPKDSCLLATSTVATDRLGLRKGGEANVAEGAGAVARCAHEGSTVIVSREGTGDMIVLVAAASGMGGAQGLREVAHDGGVSIDSVYVAPSDRGWDAKQILVASQIPEDTITTAIAPEIPVEPEPRVVALSFGTPSALTPETPADTYSYCAPPLDEHMRHGTCVFSGSQKWRTEGGADAVGGLARAKLPFWLFAMQTASDPSALKGMTQLLTLARHLARDGFSPTTLEAVTELPHGTEVLGRAGEDAIVAVGIAPAEPYVYALSDGPAWTLDREPRVVALQPLQRVTLSSRGKNLPSKATRRTVVFRRSKH